MKSKVIYALIFLWSGFIAFSLPICFGWIYMDITGNSKGFDYDLGSEKDISIMMGVIELLIWLALAVPSNIYVFKKAKEKGSYYFLIPVMVFIVLFTLCVYFIGGWGEFAKLFHA